MKVHSRGRQSMQLVRTKVSTTTISAWTANEQSSYWCCYSCCWLWRYRTSTDFRIAPPLARVNETIQLTESAIQPLSASQ